MSERGFALSRLSFYLDGRYNVLTGGSCFYFRLRDPGTDVRASGRASGAFDGCLDDIRSIDANFVFRNLIKTEFDCPYDMREAVHIHLVGESDGYSGVKGSQKTADEEARTVL
ncbi:hypothetical protein PsorP6_011518 [Peronosclerospora sorghi]|uniref:Uncharacterized protein n=1 Tax=Peronosclerospora sorghi TaxID=230839 RepID=A0ACC0WHG3_9STRA|nr:hypothetical protein PsorP6_011518 [Peronosclerospora sorghi]